MADSNKNVEKVTRFSEIIGNTDTGPTVEQIACLLNTERLNGIQKESAKELKELAERQEKVRKLHQLVAAINNNTDKNGKLKVEKGSELEKLLKEAEKMGIKLKKTNGTYEGVDRQNMVDNIGMFIDDLNTQNDMQLQKVTRLTNERYESYQLAKSMIKPDDEAKKNIARNIAR